MTISLCASSHIPPVVCVPCLRTKLYCRWSAGDLAELPPDPLHPHTPLLRQVRPKPLKCDTLSLPLSVLTHPLHFSRNIWDIAPPPSHLPPAPGIAPQPSELTQECPLGDGCVERKSRRQARICGTIPFQREKIQKNCLETT